MPTLPPGTLNHSAIALALVFVTACAGGRDDWVASQARPSITERMIAAEESGGSQVRSVPPTVPIDDLIGAPQIASLERHYRAKVIVRRWLPDTGSPPVPVAPQLEGVPPNRIAGPDMLLAAVWLVGEAGAAVPGPEADRVWVLNSGEAWTAPLFREDEHWIAVPGSWQLVAGLRALHRSSVRLCI